MISVILNVLRILGILVLVLLAIALLIILLVLFVPIRYTIAGQKSGAGTTALSFRVKVTWLLHILNLQFRYPNAAYLRVRIFCFTVFRSDRRAASSDPQKSHKISSEDTEKETCKNESAQVSKPDNQINSTNDQKPESKTKSRTDDNTEIKPEGSIEEKIKAESSEAEEEPTKRGFFKKLIFLLKNIKYTITKICDKIKHIVKNIKYYLEILRSDSFKNAFSVCKTQVFALLKSVRPRKIKGSLLIGTGDPASTGQVLAVYGMLYPLIGNNIIVTPDFEHSVIEGDLFIKGKITVFCLLKAAWIIFFNKDIRRVIKLLKREAA